MRSVGLSRLRRRTSCATPRRAADAEFLHRLARVRADRAALRAGPAEARHQGDVRVVDSAQYKRREDTHDYDIIVDNFPQSESPGNEQRDFWGSAAADHDGTRNTIGIKNPAVDKLIDKVVFAKDRDELRRGDARARPRAAVELLRRAAVVLSLRVHRDWDIFGRPDELPSQTSALIADLVVRPREAEGRSPRARGQ